MDTRRTRMLGGWGLLAIGALGLALALSGLGRAAARPIDAKATGALRISSSNAEEAILGAADLAPGDSARGAVVIHNRGHAPAALTLAASDLREGGGDGGHLAAALWLTVRDVTGKSNAIVYSGSFAAMRSLRVGALAPGEHRQYAFEATLPDGASPLDDDPLAGSWAKVDYRWTLTAAAAAKCATRLYGDGGPNRVVGTVGGDRIAGGAGRDRLLGEGGEDCIDGGSGRDQLDGGPGDDVLRARDGVADVVYCGAGEDDLAIVDAKDILRSCEHVR